MKRLLPVFLLVLILLGCKNKNESVEPALQLRDKLLDSNGCRFNAVITADYGEEIYTFAMECQTDSIGNLSFCVTYPESISGIKGKVDESSGKLTFDDQVLAFELMADGQITPVSGPWLMIRTLRSGYIRAGEIHKDGAHVIIDDSYDEKALQLDMYLTKDNLPMRGEILWNGKRIVSVDVTNFVYL